MIHRIVIDSNPYVSRFLNPTSVPGQAVKRAWSESTTLVSIATMLELRSVLRRDKFAKYVDQSKLAPYFEYVRIVAEQVTTNSTIRACRHPKDDKFLELAVDGKADLILTGDQDLLTLHPFRTVSILTPAQFLASI